MNQPHFAKPASLSLVWLVLLASGCSGSPEEETTDETEGELSFSRLTSSLEMGNYASNDGATARLSGALTAQIASLSVPFRYRDRNTYWIKSGTITVESSGKYSVEIPGTGRDKCSIAIEPGPGGKSFRATGECTTDTYDKLVLNHEFTRRDGRAMVGTYRAPGGMLVVSAADDERMKLVLTGPDGGELAKHDGSGGKWETHGRWYDFSPRTNCEVRVVPETNGGLLLATRGFCGFDPMTVERAP